MRKVFVGLIAVLLLLTPAVMGASTGGSIDLDIGIENFKPIIWLCDHRIVFDDLVQPGRYGDEDGGDILYERTNNYAFEGEQVMWVALVLDKNGVEKIDDVYVVAGKDETGDMIVECNEKDGISRSLYETCNARLDEEEFDYGDFEERNGDTMRAYYCLMTVPAPDTDQNEGGLSDETWISVVAEDIDGEVDVADESEYWFFNPEIALAIESSGDDDEILSFESIRPGTSAYSDTILIINDAEEDSGVLLDMFISGTDFISAIGEDAKCADPVTGVETNKLALTAFKYYATNGAYNSGNHPGGNGVDPASSDNERYVGIPYNSDSLGMEGANEIISNGPDGTYDCSSLADCYEEGNQLTPGAEVALTFRLDLPEPCYGNFVNGQIFFWGEAV